MAASMTGMPTRSMPGRGIEAGARLDRLPIGSFHRRILWLIGLGMFLDACDIYLAGGVLGSLVKSGWSTLELNAAFLSATFLGMLAGTFSAGLLGDRFGRRFSYQINLLIFGLASLAAAFAPDMHWLIGFRFLMGIGLGAEIVVGYASLAEFMPRAKRGRYVALLAVITNTAVPVTGLGGAWLIPELGWRPMFGIVGACALLVWVLRKNMPESPRWLESRGRVDEAEALLAGIEAEAARHGPLPPIPQAPPVQPGQGSIGELFAPGLLRNSILGIIIAVLSGVNLYGFLSWVPTFLIKGGLSVGSSLWFSGIMGIGAPLGALVGSILADRFGRVRSLVTFALIEAVLGLLYPLVGNGAELVCVGFVMTLAAYGIVSVGYALYIPELFPTRIRLRGVSLATGTGRLTSSGVGWLIVSIFGAFGLGGVSGFLTFCMLLLAAAVLVLGRETSRRSLEELAATTDHAALPRADAVPIR